ncbi:hypothetical protein ACQJBY_068086 [Aegilops geniculata]
MAGARRRGLRIRRLMPPSRVAEPRALPTPGTALLPEIDPNSPEAQREMRRVVRERFPNREAWGDIHLDILRRANFAERARFIGDDGCMDVELLFWAIQEAESPDPAQAVKWAFFKTANPSRLNIRPPSVEGIARIPPKFLPPGVELPRRRL